jgi:hypothetical protein
MPVVMAGAMQFKTLSPLALHAIAVDTDGSSRWTRSHIGISCSEELLKVAGFPFARPNPSVNSDAPVRVVSLAGYSGGAPVTLDRC